MKKYVLILCTLALMTAVPAISQAEMVSTSVPSESASDGSAVPFLTKKPEIRQELRKLGVTHFQVEQEGQNRLILLLDRNDAVKASLEVSHPAAGVERLFLDRPGKQDLAIQMDQRQGTVEFEIGTFSGKATLDAVNKQWHRNRNTEMILGGHAALFKLAAAVYTDVLLRPKYEQDDTLAADLAKSQGSCAPGNPVDSGTLPGTAKLITPAPGLSCAGYQCRESQLASWAASYCCEEVKEKNNICCWNSKCVGCCAHGECDTTCVSGDFWCFCARTSQACSE